MSGTKIKRGSLYIAYHPFVEDFRNKKVYVTKREIKAISDFLDILPKDMVTYEDWYTRLNNCYQYDVRNGGG